MFDKNKRNNFKLELIQKAKLIGEYDFPKLKISNYIPKNLIPFNFAITEKSPSDKWVHFFIDDYQFERLWSNPTKYLHILKKFEGVLTPNFSMYTDMPIAIQIWNCYRNRALAYWLQENEIKIIPTVLWSYMGSENWCYDGLPIGSTVAITTQGTQRYLNDKNNFNYGFYNMINRIKPKTVIIYGKLNYDISKYYNNVEIFIYDNYCKKFEGVI